MMTLVIKQCSNVYTYLLYIQYTAAFRYYSYGLAYKCYGLFLEKCLNLLEVRRVWHIAVTCSLAQLATPGPPVLGS